MPRTAVFFDCKDTELKYFNRPPLKDTDFILYKQNLTPSIAKNLDNQTLNSEILSVFITSELNEKTLKYFPKLKLIISRSTGLNHIDLDYCKKRGIAVENICCYGAITVAEFTLGLILALTRKIVKASQFSTTKKVNFNDFQGTDIFGKTIGIVGAGEIGSNVARRCVSLGMKVLIDDIKINKDLAKQKDIKYTSLDNLLKHSDIVSLHCPYIPGKNYHMFDKKTFSKMKEGAYFINTARGELVDINALSQVLKSGKLAGAALDVVEYENVKEKDLKCKGEICRYDSADQKKIAAYISKKDEIHQMENVIITPHIAFDTTQALHRILDSTMLKIKGSK